MTDLEVLHKCRTIELAMPVNHPQTNGKLERLHGEIQLKLANFEGIIMKKSYPIDLFMDWYDNCRPHQSLDFENLETPTHAFARKMPPMGETDMDEQTWMNRHG